MDRFVAERGDVLLWLQAAGEVASDQGQAAMGLGAEAAGAMARPGRRTEDPLTDPETGVGTELALRRAVDLERRFRSVAVPPFVLLEIRVVAADRSDPLDGKSRSLIMKRLVEVGPFVLRGRDRIFRTGPAELTILLDGASPGGQKAARGRLEAALARSLSDRRVPEVRLIGRTVDPTDLFDRMVIPV